MLLHDSSTTDTFSEYVLDADNFPSLSVDNIMNNNLCVVLIYKNVYSTLSDGFINVTREQAAELEAATCAMNGNNKDKITFFLLLNIC
jgi:hypothetical protein